MKHMLLRKISLLNREFTDYGVNRGTIAYFCFTSYFVECVELNGDIQSCVALAHYK